MAILPANVLVSDSAAQWLKIGVPLVLQQDLMTASALIPGIALNESAARQQKADQLLQIKVESRAGGLHIEATVTDVKTGKVLQVKSGDGGSAADVITAANALAKKLDPEASSYSTNSVDALKSYLAAASSSDRQQRGHLLQQAIGQDAGFGIAYIALAEMLGPKSVNLTQFISEAKARRDKFSGYDRSKFDLAVSRLTSAPAREQIKQAQQGLQFAPNDIELLTVLGMNEFLEGDAKGGEETLRRAIRLSPANPGLQLQLGRGLMEARRLKEADAVFTAIPKNPAVLPDLATCVLLEGDVTRANSIAEQIFGSLQNEDLKPLLRASWQVMSGQRQKGVDMLLSAKFSNPTVEGLAYSEAAIWQAMAKDYARARSSLQRATVTPGRAVSFPAVAALLTETPEGSAADWQKRVEGSALPGDVKEPLLGYGFFLRGNYDEAALQWRQMLDRSHGNDLRARAMLASSLDYAGRKTQAREIKVMPFVPEFGDLYGAIPFAEMRRMLGI